MDFLQFLTLFFTLLPFASSDRKPPTVFISVLIRNKAHILPYFLTCLENQNYPKSRIILYLKSDHNEDESIELLEAWLDRVLPRREYHDIIKDFQDCQTENCLLPGETSPVGWNSERFKHIMSLRQKAIGTVLRYFVFKYCDYQ